MRASRKIPATFSVVSVWMIVSMNARGRVGRTEGRNTYNGHTQSRMLKTYVFQIFGAALAITA